MSNNDHESVRQALITMLRSCADYLSALPADEVDAILDGELEVRLSVVSKKVKPKKKQVSVLDATKLSDIATRLRSLDNRAEGERLLRDVAPTRSALETLARYLDVAARREDRIDDLTRRIIESTIGFRLSSAAIQGRPLGRDRDERSDSYSAQAKK